MENNESKINEQIDVEKENNEENNEFKISEINNIKKDDLYKYNYYLASLNKNLGMLIASLFILGFGIYGIIADEKDAKHLVVNSLFIALGVLGILLVFVFSKLIIKKKVDKLKLEDLEPVEVTLSKEGILYKFVNEAQNEGQTIQPFTWNEVSRVVLKDEYIYIHMVDHVNVLLITRRDLTNPDFIKCLEDMLAPKKRFFDKTK